MIFSHKSYLYHFSNVKEICGFIYLYHFQFIVGVLNKADHWYAGRTSTCPEQQIPQAPNEDIQTIYSTFKQKLGNLLKSPVLFQGREEKKNCTCENLTLLKLENKHDSRGQLRPNFRM